jgi:AcrR family transcriptional regulator
MAERAPAKRSGGRPTTEQAARLDNAVREAALQMFLERGYEGTSMDAIASAAGTTKASLYARYPSKDEIFATVLNWAASRKDWPFPDDEPPAPDDLEVALTAVAEASVRRALHPSLVQLSRIAISQAARFPELGRSTLSVGAWERRGVVVELLEHHAATGAIVLVDDPEILAEDFLAMVSGMPARLASLGVLREPDDQSERTRIAVRLFVRSLRP